MNDLRLMPVTGYLLGGMILWVVSFTGSYAMAAVVCARGLADTLVLGVPILPFSTGLTTVVALAGTGLIATVAYRRRSRTTDDDELPGFVWSVALLVATLGFVGIVWNGLPALLFAGCA
jgi:hypothetical protein